MSRQAAIEHLLDHYEHPRNRGALAAPDATAIGGAPDCSDSVTVYLQLSGDGKRVARMTFEGEGCTISQAAASILSEAVIGMSLIDLAALDPNVWIDTLGRAAVETRQRCAVLPLRALKHAVAMLQQTRAAAIDR